MNYILALAAPVGFMLTEPRDFASVPYWIMALLLYAFCVGLFFGMDKLISVLIRSER